MLEFGALCIGGFIIGCILAVVIGVLVVQQQREQEKLEWEIELRRRKLKAQGLLKEQEKT